MEFADTPADAAFREEVAEWLRENVIGDFADLGGRGGSGDETYGFEVRREWERVLGQAGWTCIGWPVEYGGRGATISQQVIFNEEYVRAKAPGRVGVLGEGLLGPTVIHYGTPEQKDRFLPPIVAGEELWSQGYSEPNAGSDLASLTTRAELDGDEWSITGQKVWTSLAHQSDWCFVLCRTEPGSLRHTGLSYLLGHLLSFRREFDGLLHAARKNGRTTDPILRDRLTRAFVELEILRATTLRSLTGVDGPAAAPEASILKLFWSSWHQNFGELAMDVLGLESMITGPNYDLNSEQRTFLFSRSETIYGGSNEIQRNIIGERVLGLPVEPKPQSGGAP